VSTAVSVQGFDVVDERDEACVKGAYENTGRSIKRRWFVQRGSQDLKMPKDNTLRVSERSQGLVRTVLLSRSAASVVQPESKYVTSRRRIAVMIVGEY
jgi:uncharacterized protein YajQ (UPF0234 family)